MGGSAGGGGKDGCLGGLHVGPQETSLHMPGRPTGDLMLLLFTLDQMTHKYKASLLWPCLDVDKKGETKSTSSTVERLIRFGSGCQTRRWEQQQKGGGRSRTRN